MWEALDVVIGMFLVNCQSASLLFDSKASHSFIYAHFVRKHTMFMHNMKKTMLACQFTRGEMRATFMCPKVELVIRG